MGPNELAIATISLARDDDEERLLTRALTALDGQGIPMFIADGGSPGSFLATLRSLANATLVEPDGPGLVRQVRASVRAAAASGARRVLYTEPDKLAFFENGLAGFVEASSARAGASIAARSAAAFATFPPMQRTTERAIDGVAAELTGGAGDYCYGPFILHPRLGRLLATIPDDLGWGWRFVLFIAAHRAGAGIELIEGDFVCPPDQREESERDRFYRITQLEQNVRGALIGARTDLTGLGAPPWP